jgi:hypothetical protein
VRTGTDATDKGRPFPVRKTKNVIAAPEGTDARPERLGTISDSDKARPSWPGYAEPSGQVRGLPYAPQPTSTEGEQLLAALAKGPGIRSEAEGALIVCRVRYDGNPDQGFKFLAGATAPDLDAEISLNPLLPQLTVHGPEDRHDMFVALPLMTLKKAGRLRIHAYDRDELGREDLGQIAMDATLFPTRATAGDLVVDCAAADRDQVEAALVPALAETDAALLRIATDPSIRLADPTFGLYPTEAELGRAIAPAARLVGWSDTRVQRRIAWAERVRGALLEQAKAQIQADWAQSSSEADVFTGSTKIHAQLVSLSCGKSPTLGSTVAFHLSADDKRRQRCELVVTAHNIGPEAASAKAFFGDFFPSGWKPVVALADGTTVPARLVGIKKGDAEESEDDSLGPDEHGTLRFIADMAAAPDSPTPGKLFITHGGGGLVALRLPPAAAPAASAGPQDR